MQQIFYHENSKRELQQIASNHLSDIDFKILRNFIKIILKNHIYF